LPCSSCRGHPLGSRRRVAYRDKSGRPEDSLDERNPIGFASSIDVMPGLLETLSRAGEFVEITCRAFQSRSMLKRSHALRKAFVGALGRAQDMRHRGVAVISSHFHLLIAPDDVEQVSRFMQHLKTCLS